MIEKREHVRATLTVEAAGHEFAMTRMSAADGGLVASALGAIVDSSLPDGSELDLAEGLALMRAWVKAHKDDAVPPA
jgi:hypothetical protein